MKKSNWLTVNEKDIIKGFVVAILSAGLTALYNLLQSGTTIEKAQLVACLMAGITAGLGYIIKNLFTSSTDEFKPEQPII